ncbi:hypothetical protein ACP70R_010614 [Stipagrostis hirtigluma subsp. patula]
MAPTRSATTRSTSTLLVAEAAIDEVGAERCAGLNRESR